MNPLPGMPTTPADVWSGAGVWHVSAVARLLVPDRPAAAASGGPRLPRPRSSSERQRAAKTPAG